MSQSVLTNPPTKVASRRLHGLRSVLIAAGALALVILLGALASYLFGLGPQTPAPRSPFGVGLREGGGDITGVAGWILSVQSAFSRAITAALHQLKTGPEAAWSLVGLSFAYGVFHAAGPGHGKAVVAAYILASEKALKKGLAMAGAAAMLQSLVAIAIVCVLALLFDATAGMMTATASRIEILSFAAVASVGAVLLWQKSRSLSLKLADEGHGHGHGHDHHHHHGHDHHHHGEHAHTHDHHDHVHGPDCGCGHVHAPVAPEGSGWRGAASAVVAAGIRPCSGAIVVLVFALSQGMFAMGAVSTLAMGLGTAITTGSLAALAVLAKSAVQRFAGGKDSVRAVLAVKMLEVLAAATVTALGLTLVFGALMGANGGS